MPAVTTVIPAYNAGAFVAKAIDSALAQGVAQQIVVVDDGSTDDTAEVVAAYGDSVELIRQANGGVSAARNRGIAAAGGEFIAFLDADDVWLPGKLGAQLDLFGADPGLGTVICDEIHVTSEGSVVRPSFLATRRCHDELPAAPARLTRPLTWLVRESFFPTSGVLVRREVLRRAGNFDTSLSICEDRDLWLRLALQGPVGLVPEVLLRYLTGRADSLSILSSRVRWARALRQVLGRYRAEIEPLVRAEGESPEALFGAVFAELGEIFWYADCMDDAAANFGDAMRCGVSRCIPKWFAARTGTAALARRLNRLLRN